MSRILVVSPRQNLLSARYQHRTQITWCLCGIVTSGNGDVLFPIFGGPGEKNQCGNYKNTLLAT